MPSLGFWSLMIFLLRMRPLGFFSMRVFSTSDRLLSDVLLLSKVRKIAFSVNFCEAVGGRVRPCSPDWLSDLSEPIRVARPHTASQIGLSDRPHRSGSPKFGLTRTRPHNFCHVICLSQSGEHGLTRPPTASQKFTVRPWKSEVRGADRTLPGEAMRLAVKSVRRARGSQCLARSPRVRSVRPICEAVWGRVRPICEAVWGRVRPHRSASHIGLSDRFDRSDRS